MSPFVLLMIAAGVVLLWYAVTGVNPFTTIRGVIAPGSTPAKSTTTGTGNKQNGG